jgi:Domain of unknown function (DUF4287)
MSTVDQGLHSQIQNIEAKYGRPIDDWVELIRASGRTRHGEIVAMLKTEYGLSHGAANRVALVAMDALAPKNETTDPEVALYAGNRRSSRCSIRVGSQLQRPLHASRSRPVNRRGRSRAGGMAGGRLRGSPIV